MRDRGELEALSQIGRYMRPAAAAPLTIVAVCDPASKRFAEVVPIDVAIYTEHLRLGIVSEGLEGVWTGVYPFEDRVKSANRILGIPAGQLMFSVLPLGYSAEEEAPEDRFDPVRIHEV